ncbi:MAG: hypothetical protein P8X60_08210 [Robiginitalea sp.]
MKKVIFFALLILAGTQLTQAQMGRYGMYGPQRSSLPRGPEVPAKEEEPKTAEELVEGEMPKITEALELNDFEQAVVSSILTKYTQQRIELQILQLPQDKAREAYEEIADNQKRELQQGLPAEKFDAFMDLAENGFKSKKKKKKKKKKKT